MVSAAHALAQEAAHISVRDWRRRPPLRLRVTTKPATCWFWIKCTRCPHMAAVAITPYIIRWGPDGWLEMLRQNARCIECGKRGVSLQHPSWGGNDTGWAPMPINQLAPVPGLD
jgi:hypothetical protein